MLTRYPVGVRLQIICLGLALLMVRLLVSAERFTGTGLLPGTSDIDRDLIQLYCRGRRRRHRPADSERQRLIPCPMLRFRPVVTRAEANEAVSRAPVLVRLG